MPFHFLINANAHANIHTVEPPNKGHIGTSHFIHYREVVLYYCYGKCASYLERLPSSQRARVL